MNRKENILVEAVKSQDRAAQRELYELYCGRLYAAVLRYVGRRDVAEDILQDSFVKIFRSIDTFTFRGEGSLRAWMQRIAVNVALEWLRSQKKMEVIACGDDQLIASASVVEPTVEQVESISESVILEMIAQLPDGYRTVFNLFEIEGYSHKEIAEELGINEKSSSSQLLRAKRILAKKISQLR